VANSITGGPETTSTTVGGKSCKHTCKKHHKHTCKKHHKHTSSCCRNKH
jgi:hypothetical protein